MSKKYSRCPKFNADVIVVTALLAVPLDLWVGVFYHGALARLLPSRQAACGAAYRCWKSMKSFRMMLFIDPPVGTVTKCPGSMIVQCLFLGFTRLLAANGFVFIHVHVPTFATILVFATSNMSPATTRFPQLTFTRHNRANSSVGQTGELLWLNCRVIEILLIDHFLMFLMFEKWQVFKLLPLFAPATVIMSFIIVQTVFRCCKQ